ncbi:MAG: VWA domain-containing protein, partial [Planctomycetales bacterium]|nr:VWA domain-containing protein [Planctomycetales bacterium]
MNGFRFVNPQWIHLIWAVAAFAIMLVMLELRGQSALNRLLSSHMQIRLIRRVSLGRRLVAVALFTGALLCLVFAIMRPQWGRAVQAETRVESQIMICLDVSKSMLAEDVVPNRLDRAKAEIEALLGLLDEGQQVGLLAFAGKASVLCPMTTDFGFLRLILEETSPESIGLGGTRIGEALQKAVDGFRETGDINRLILLITDGEDHDSIPLDAAKAAKEKGVRIVSIGFGDEAGSKIQYTDPRTGSRDYVTDRNGDAVITRLDGEMLREIALETEGAYIPAGTGALDLESIYQAHVATMLKGTMSAEERIVRNEAFQWCVLAGLALWIASLLNSTNFSLSAAPGRRLANTASISGRKLTRATAVLAAVLLTPAAAVAQNALTAEQPDASTVDDDAALNLDPAAADSASRADAITSEEVVGNTSAGGKQPEEIELPPRELYNYAIAFVPKDLERAETLLTSVRNRAGVDGELRYRATYNLGWVEVAKADSLLEEQPAEALKHLQLAAGRFREAVRIRPESTEARHNLEITARRILELADSLRQKEDGDLAQRLDALLNQLREHQSQLQAIVAKYGDEAAVDDDLRRKEFRNQGISQRGLISDLEQLAESGRQELDALQAKPEEELQPPDRMRIAQLNNALSYVERSLEWMQKARSFTRRLEGQRAFLRWSTALNDVRRGRDQLRNPVEILSSIAGDAIELAGLTQLKNSADPQPNSGPADQIQDSPPSRLPLAPAWLTNEYLEQSQQSITERSQELHAMFSFAVDSNSQSQLEKNGLDQTQVDVENDSSADNTTGEDEAQAMLFDSIRLALPLISDAGSQFQLASERISQSDLTEASNLQGQAIANLSNAAELFFDFRRLIELIYADELTVKASLTVANQSKDETGTATDNDSATRSASESAMSVGQSSDELAELQRKNLVRADRLKKLFEMEMQQIAATESNANATTTDANDKNATAENENFTRFQTAQQLLADAVSAMNSVNARLSTLGALGSSQTDTETTEAPAGSGDETEPTPGDEIPQAQDASEIGEVGT